MAIQINGNGTITGINVGGLPDGIVDTDMIANNAVTNAKATGIAGGKILQVVNATTNTEFTNTTTTYQDTNLTATITPSATSSKVLVLVTQPWEIKASPGVSAQADIKLLRGSTDIYVSTNAKTLGVGDGDNDYKELLDICNIHYLDSPNTTSATTYKTMGRCNNSSNNLRFRCQDDSNPSSMTLIEVAA